MFTFDTQDMFFAHEPRITESRFVARYVPGGMCRFFVFAGLLGAPVVPHITRAQIANAVLVATPAHRGRVTTVAWSPGGKTYASGGDDGRVIVWSAATGKPLVMFAPGKQPVHALAFAPNGVSLACGIGDALVLLYPASGKRKTVHTAFSSGDTLAVAWSPGGKTLAFVTETVTVELWDGAKRRRGAVWTLGGPFRAVAFAPNGRWAVAGSERYVPPSPDPHDANPADDSVGSGTSVVLFDPATVREEPPAPNVLAPHPPKRVTAMFPRSLSRLL